MTTIPMARSPHSGLPSAITGQNRIDRILNTRKHNSNSDIYYLFRKKIEKCKTVVETPSGCTVNLQWWKIFNFFLRFVYFWKIFTICLRSVFLSNKVFLRSVCFCPTKAPRWRLLGTGSWNVSFGKSSKYHSWNWRSLLCFFDWYDLECQYLSYWLSSLMIIWM